MEKIKKFLYVTIGIISFGLGAIGVVLPVLPTTPFLLLSSFCFVRGSERFDKWFKGTKLYKKHLESFVNNRQMTLKGNYIIICRFHVNVSTYHIRFTYGKRFNRNSYVN